MATDLLVVGGEEEEGEGSPAFMRELGPRPEPPLVDEAKASLHLIDTRLHQELAHLSTMQVPLGTPAPDKWLAEKVEKAHKDADTESLPHKSVVHLDELYNIYEDMVRQGSKEDGNNSVVTKTFDILSSFLKRDHTDYTKREVALLLLGAVHKGSGVIDLSGRCLSFLPNSFGNLNTLTSLDLSSNQLKELPESLCELENLELLDLHSNQLTSLPNSIGKLKKLKILSVSGNMLKALPENLAECNELVECIAGFNELSRLPARIGGTQLQKLSLHSNKLNYIPSSICETTSLQILDLHFNSLALLPSSLGDLYNLRILNLSHNFSDFEGGLPESMVDMIALEELDLSFNQIRVLPDFLGSLDNLHKLIVHNNPLVIPPLEVVEHSPEVVKEYLANRWQAEAVPHQQTCVTMMGPRPSWLLHLIDKCNIHGKSPHHHPYSKGLPPSGLLHWNKQEYTKSETNSPNRSF